MRTITAHSAQQKSSIMAAGCMGLSRKRGGAPTGDRKGAPATELKKRDFIMTTQETIFLRSLTRFSLKNSNFQFSAIRLRIRIDGDRLTYYLPVEYKICPRHWNAEAGEAITSPKKNPDIKGDPMLAVSLLNINKEIERTGDAFIEAYQEVRHSGLPLTVEAIKAAMRIKLGRVEEQIPEPQPEAEPEAEQPQFNGLLEFMDFYIVQCEKGAILNNKGLPLSPGTIRNYKSARAAVNRYNKGRRRELGLHTFSIADYNDFVNYLNDSTHARGRYCINVLGKFFKDLRHIMRYAYDYGYTENLTYKHRDFKVPQTLVQTVYLTEEELDALNHLDLPDNEASVRDAFLISCYTGLRHSDIEQLTADHFDLKNNTLTISTRKTGARVVIPIHHVIREILERNGNKPPKANCNQSSNRRLKLICQKAGIDQTVLYEEIRGGKSVKVSKPKYELITTHAGRRTFCTLAVMNEIPTQLVMKLSGHRTESNFNRYVRVTADQIADSLQSHKFFNGNSN